MCCRDRAGHGDKRESAARCVPTAFLFLESAALPEANLNGSSQRGEGGSLELLLAYFDLGFFACV